MGLDGRLSFALMLRRGNAHIASGYASQLAAARLNAKYFARRGCLTRIAKRRGSASLLLRSEGSLPFVVCLCASAFLPCRHSRRRGRACPSRNGLRSQTGTAKRRCRGSAERLLRSEGSFSSLSLPLSFLRSVVVVGSRSVCSAPKGRFPLCRCRFLRSAVKTKHPIAQTPINKEGA